MAIPRKLAEEIQFKCRNKCCICGAEGIQIHHLDGNPNNGVEDNLAPLCMTHHEKAQKDLSAPVSFTQKLTPSVIKLFRDNCYKRNEFEFQPPANWNAPLNEIKEELASIKEIITRKEGFKHE